MTALEPRFGDVGPLESVLRRRTSSAASANSQSRNVEIFGSVDVALGQTIQ